jgi:predicted RNase H-like HicB family nuclease
VRVTARARRSGGWWAVDVPEVEGVYTQARRLDQVETQVADAVATMLGMDPGAIEVILDPELPEGLANEVRSARCATQEALQAQARASQAARVAALNLSSEHLSTRDVGKLLGVSHQRVSQLIATASEVEVA